MTALRVISGVTCYLAVLLAYYWLARTPRSVPVRVVAVMITCLGLSFALGLASSTGHPVLGLAPLTTRLLQNLAEAATAYSLIAFYLFAALQGRAARRRALWHAVPLGAAFAIMIGAAALMPVGVRAAAAALASGAPGGPVSVPSVAALYLTVNLYQAVAYATALCWTRRYARGAEPRLRRGLALVSVGLAVAVLALTIFATANVVRWAGGSMPHILLMIGIASILCGFVIFLVGFTYPATSMRCAALRVWWQHRGRYHRLRPLWTMLNREFPEGQLNRVPATRWRDALGPRRVHRRYYRRVIECRDGLVRISPYLGPDDGRALADRLRDAGRAHAAGCPAPPHAMPVAIPAVDGLDADVRELVRLSDALPPAGTRAKKGVPRSTGLGVTGSTEPPRSYTSSPDHAVALPVQPRDGAPGPAVSSRRPGPPRQDGRPGVSTWPARPGH